MPKRGDAPKESRVTKGSQASFVNHICSKLALNEIILPKNSILLWIVFLGKRSISWWKEIQTLSFLFYPIFLNNDVILKLHVRMVIRASFEKLGL